jgi:hypothetical protein
MFERSVRLVRVLWLRRVPLLFVFLRVGRRRTPVTAAAIGTSLANSSSGATRELDAGVREGLKRAEAVRAIAGNLAIYSPPDCDSARDGLERAEAVRQHLQQPRGNGQPFARVRELFP